MKAKKKPRSNRVASDDGLESLDIDFYHPHRVMTRDEYDVLKLKGLHSVCHDWDRTGGTAIWMRSNAAVKPRRCDV